MICLLIFFHGLDLFDNIIKPVADSRIADSRQRGHLFQASAGLDELTSSRSMVAVASRINYSAPS